MMQGKDPEQNRNMILAVVLSLGVMFAWQYFIVAPKMREKKERQRLEQTAKTPQPGAQTAANDKNAVKAPAAAATPGQPANTPSLVPRTASSRDAALKTDKRLPIKTPSIIGSLNLKGARIDDITLVKYHDKPDPKSPRVVIFSPANAPGAHFAEFQWVAAAGTKVKVPGADTVWTAPEAATLEPGKPVTLTWDNGEGLTFSRTISVDENYMFTVSDEVKNAGDKPVTLFPYAFIDRYGTPKVEGFFIQHEGLIGVLGEQGLQKLTYNDVRAKDGAKRFDQIQGGWLGFTDKYWGAALIPDQKAKYDASLRSPNPERRLGAIETYKAEYLLAGKTVPAGGTAKTQSHLFVGAKKVQMIEDYESNLSIKQFELLIDWGWFYFITKPLYYLLHWLYGLIGNFGFAILAVTVIVKAAFFWFANKSYESMAKMKKLQPEMEKIRSRYSDKMEQQKALMDLYKNEKINPLAGCLPVLVQIPVFFALYKVLFISIDMRHAPFVGWIRDLSAPDPTTIFNLFGILPYAVPEWLPALGIWPLIMGVTMWLQMQLNPQQPDPVQQQVFNWMPVLFTFLLSGFAAGLVIYWAWNNILSIGQQYVIMKRQGVDVPLLDNLRKTWSAAWELPQKLLGRDKNETG